MCDARGVVRRCEGTHMYLRRYERGKNGKKHSYWALVESYRTGKGSRQRIGAYLGALRPSEQDGWAKLGQHVAGQPPPSPSLFDPPAPAAAQDAAVLVRLRGVRLEACATLARCGWPWACGGWWAWINCCRPGVKRCPGPAWSPSSPWRVSVSPAVNCTSNRPGIVARRWKTCSTCRWPRCTPIACTPAWIRCCPLKKPSRSISSSVWASYSLSLMTCCCTTSPARIL